MLFHRSKKIIEYQKDLDPSQMAFCENARLLCVNGSGAFSYSRLQANSKWYEEYLVEVKLNGVPLWRVNQSVCPTCESILATGMGIENAGAKEFREIADRINRNGADFDTAVESITPILSLLTSGLYIVADKWMFSTDGMGHFFWDVPDGPTSNLATAGIYFGCDEDRGYTWTSGEPTYLYPTQSAACYNEERVQYYVEQFQKNDIPPRAIAYHCREWMSFLLDGHHKACAAALLGKPVRCLVIMPLQYGFWRCDEGNSYLQGFCFEGMDVKVGEVPDQYVREFKEKKSVIALSSSPFPSSDLLPEECIGSLAARSWEETYKKAAETYPKVEQYALMRAADISQVTDDDICKWLACPDDEGRQKLRGILTYLQINGDKRLKKTALACAGLEFPHPLIGETLKKYAFELLCRIKEDEEVEQFFIDWLAQDEDHHSKLGWIASSYWD